MATRFSLTSASRWLPTALTTTLVVLGLSLNPGQAQTLIPANDGTGTQIIPEGDRFDIDGGSLSGDGQNLFHSFDRFDLNSGETANFLTSPEIRNVLGRIGGDASQIDGLLQLTGSAANLYLLNPAGILFGANAQLNLPASFFATSATAVTFNGGIFNLIDTPDYLALIGDPTSFQFLGGGPITSLAPLQVPDTLALLGGEVNASGNLSAGQLLIQGIPGEATLRISQPGFVLSLELSAAPETSTDVPGLLTGGEADSGEVMLDTSGDVPRIQSGNVIIGNVNLQTPTGANNQGVVIESGGAVSTGNINTATESGGRAITLRGEGNVTSQALFSGGGAIAIESASGSIGTGNLTTTGLSGGDITLNAAGNINSGTLDSEGLGGAGGNITTVAGGETEIVSADGRGTSSGGNLNLSQSRLRVPGAVASGLIIDEDISLATSAGGSIRIELTEFGVPFEVGNPSISGSSGSLSAGGDRLDASFISTPGTFTQGAISIISPQAPPEEAQPQLEEIEVSEDIERLQRIPGQDSTPVNLRGSRLESEIRYTNDFVEYLGLDARPALSLDDTRALLGRIEEDTGEKPALLYLQFLPSIQLNSSQTNLKQLGSGLLQIDDDPLNDGLEILVVTADGEPVRVVVDDVTRSQVIEAAFELRSNLTNPRLRRSDRYLQWSQQLYDILIRPLNSTLQERDITNLTFISDTGLRTLPLGVLHDGEQFLIEHYNLSLIPSLSLTDTRRGNLQNTQVLAMGASIFPFNENLSPLPAVSTELKTISQQLWPGVSFLNEDFTVETLRQQRRQTPYGIIHLATHGEFTDGDASNSYIQLWDERLNLNEIRRLNLNRPPVELLVLSACRTAVGSAEAELGFAGLAVASGAKSALGSLWYVSDDGTLGLMTEFYSQLRQHPTRSEALRQTQIALLNGEVRVEGGQLITSELSFPLPPELAAQIPDRDFSHPYFWSAFSLVGNPW